MDGLIEIIILAGCIVLCICCCCVVSTRRTSNRRIIQTRDQETQMSPEHSVQINDYHQENSTLDSKEIRILRENITNQNK